MKAAVPLLIACNLLIGGNAASAKKPTYTSAVRHLADQIQKEHTPRGDVVPNWIVNTTRPDNIMVILADGRQRAPAQWLDIAGDVAERIADVRRLYYTEQVAITFTVTVVSQGWVPEAISDAHGTRFVGPH